MATPNRDTQKKSESEKIEISDIKVGRDDQVDDAAKETLPKDNFWEDPPEKKTGLLDPEDDIPQDDRQIQDIEEIAELDELDTLLDSSEIDSPTDQESQESDLVSIETKDLAVIDLQAEPDLSEVEPIAIENLDQLEDLPQLEMRQIAGLSAGSKMTLPEGNFNFKEGDKQAAFTLSVEQNRTQVTVIPGASEVWIDDHLVTGPTSLSGGVLDVGSARFTIRPPRPGYGPYTSEIEPKERAVITVPEFDDATETTPWVPRASTNLPQTNLDTQSWEFMEQIRSERDENARLQRLLHPDPEELSYRMTQNGFGLLNRSISHPFFSRFSIAYGPIPWIPKFSDSAAIPARLHRNIDDISSLNSVPISSNLTKGPLGVVGPRSAVLACIRHMVLSVVTLNEPGSIELKVITTNKNHNASWQWLSNLPSWISSLDNTFRVVVADGMRSYELAGLDHDDAAEKRIGLIIAASSLKELPPYCSTVLQVSQSGFCKATNQKGHSIQGTPIGVSENFAAEMAESLHNLHPTLTH